MQAKEISTGAIVVYEGEPVLIETLKVQTPSARGAATLYKYRGRNLVTKEKVDFVLKGGDSLDEADFEKRSVSMMYTDQTHLHLMDNETYNQFALELTAIEWERNFLVDGCEGLFALIYNDECVGIQVPVTVELTVTQCDPGVRGNSATSRAKPATLETGFVIQVPEYLKEGERVKVDTRTGEFLSRA
ncbi:MAG: elongation factor P [Planctomycetaceae bacterium]|nr:elongation factor P [Planctomycetaceae bacterium]